MHILLVYCIPGQGEIPHLSPDLGTLDSGGTRYLYHVVSQTVSDVSFEVEPGTLLARQHLAHLCLMQFCTEHSIAFAKPAWRVLTKENFQLG